MVKNIGIIGLGRVGFPAAIEYIKKGYTVFGTARRPEMIEKFQEIGGIILPNPSEVAKRCKILIVLVLNDQQVKEVVLGDDGLLKGIKPDSVIICMSTINRKTLMYVASQCADKDVGFVDCPFTGGPARVLTQSLTLIVAAPNKLVDIVTPVLKVIGNVIPIGIEPGLGQALKHCNQLLVGATHAATMEVIVLAKRLKLDPALVCKVVGSGIAGSDYFRLLSESVLNDKPSPGGLGQMCKDVSIVSNTVSEVKMPAYIVKAATKYFNIAEAEGMQTREGAALIEIVDRIDSED